MVMVAAAPVVASSTVVMTAAAVVVTSSAASVMVAASSMMMAAPSVVVAAPVIVSAAVVPCVAPAIPAVTAAPAIAGAIGISAPIPAGALPAGVVPAIIAAVEDELSFLDRQQLIARGRGECAVRYRRLSRAGERRCGAQRQRQAKSKFSRHGPDPSLLPDAGKRLG
jgi:hypothetical protein